MGLLIASMPHRMNRLHSWPAYQVGAFVCALVLWLDHPCPAAVNENPLFIERFDTQDPVAAQGKPKGMAYHGSSLVPTGSWGQSLRLDVGTSAELRLTQTMKAEGGTISFWVQPFWNEDRDQSHTFLSFAWNDPKHSYFVLSYGWWEPQGARRLYLIVTNQEFIHCSVPRRLTVGEWSMVTAAWKSGADGYCKLYMNGEPIAESHQSFLGTYANKDVVYLGTDKGTSQAAGRSAEVLMDDITIYSRPLSDMEVAELYRSQVKNPEGALAHKWRWLEQVLANPRHATRLPSGEWLESRVILDEDMSWAKSKENTDRILSRLKAGGFNVYVPCVWHGNGTYYPTPLTEPDPKLLAATNSGDALAYLIQKAHVLGIEVHPWFTVVRRETSRHPEWYGDGVPEGAYDIHNPQFRRFIVDLMLDVVKRYDVDGINLDYIRAMGICTSSVCQDEYRRTTGNAFWPDYALRGVVGAARTRLEQWQDSAVRDLMESFVPQAKKAKPRLIVSIDGHPKSRAENRPLEGRDEVAWLNEKLIDVIFAMDYRETIDYEGLAAVRRDLREPERLIIVFGNYDRTSPTTPAIPRSGTLVAKYAAYAQHKWPSAGVAFYLYGQMTDEQLKALREGPFNELAMPSWSRSGR
ncbi:MAG TPA: family 10 glycosylhydrolase [Nitrospiraceae bacterium]|jgi:uncharacterized lipoprotein YddW (UPF0748 family)